MLRLPQSHLANVIRNCRILATGEYQPQFTLLLGAGCSKTSGILLASEMTKLFATQWQTLYGIGSLKQQKWYTPDSAYSQLFERLYPEPTLRRDHIERLIENASPSWGYLYLVNLLAKNVFNAVFTTNFDDLLNEACYLFSSDVRPIVCAHDSSIRSVRVTSRRPKIIKLHGDFLYDNIKNTVGELESLEKNMRDKFQEFAREFGMIILGYSGGDRSILDPLQALLATDYAFPHGVYWCVQEGESLRAEVEQFTRFPRFHVLEISSFDEFFADLHDFLFGEVNPVIENPYLALGTRIARILNNLEVKSPKIPVNPIIERDLISLGKAIRDPGKLSALPQPYIYKALAALRESDFETARSNTLEQITDASSTIGAVIEAVKIGIHIESEAPDASFLKSFLDAIKSCPTFKLFPNKLLRFSMELIKEQRYDFALDVLNCVWHHGETGAAIEEEYYKINVAQIHIRTAKLSDVEKEQMAEIAKNSKNPLSRFGAMVVLGQSKKAVDVIEQNLHGEYVGNTTIRDVLTWAIVELLTRRQFRRLQRIADEAVDESA